MAKGGARNEYSNIDMAGLFWHLCVFAVLMWGKVLENSVTYLDGFQVDVCIDMAHPVFQVVKGRYQAVLAFLLEFKKLRSVVKTACCQPFSFC